ncbi:MAG: hypothetical protein AB1626_02285 [Candidatus Micrarchaeota archaeon]
MYAELLAVKLFIAVAVVVVLAVIAEHISPKLAGLISGLPTGSLITLFFIGLDNGALFASNTAIYNMIGIIAMQAVLFFYYAASARFEKHALLYSAACSVVGYLGVASLLQFVPSDAILAVLLPLASIPLFIYLFRKIEYRKVEKKVKLSVQVLFWRALAAGLLILAVIEIASFVGPKWAGLLTAFPNTTFPLILIVHYTYGAKPVHAIIKAFPTGLASLIAYSLAVSVTYPLFGIYWGTAAAFTVAMAVFAVIYLFNARRERP